RSRSDLARPAWRRLPADHGLGAGRDERDDRDAARRRTAAPAIVPGRPPKPGRVLRHHPGRAPHRAPDHGGRGHHTLHRSPVVIRAVSPAQTSVSWEVHGIPERVLPTVPALDALPPHPGLPTAWYEAPAQLLDDLAGHSGASPCGLLRLGGGRTEVVGDPPG